MNQKPVVVLLNLGGPRTEAGIPDFLYRLLSDPFVMPYSKPIRCAIGKLISVLRTSKAREIYGHIGGFSPLYQNTLEQAKALESFINLPVHVAMRHAEPFIENVAQEIYQGQPSSVILIPLYPHFSMTTTQSALQEWFRVSAKYPNIPLHWVPYFYHQPQFITAQADLIRPVYDKAAQHGDPLVLASAHSLPVDLVLKGDPYVQHVEHNVKLLSNALNLPVTLSYQSKLGPKKWLEPSTESVIIEACEQKRPLVIFPVSFVSEHCETLVELDIEYAELAHQKDVPFYGRVPTLGINPTFIQCLADLACSFLDQPIRSRMNQTIC